jgi:hypothetical protein
MLVKFANERRKTRSKESIGRNAEQNFMRSPAPSQVFQLASEETIYCDGSAI